MLPVERQQAILRRLEERGSVQTAVLAMELGVTDETTRKDLDALADSGRVLRVHGGATRTSNVHYDLPLPARQAINRERKAVVAREACRLIQPSDTVFFDASSTVLMMTEFLSYQPVTVVTNAHHVVVALGGRANCDLICTGGNYEERSRSYVGAIAEEALRRFVIKWMFLGVDGFHPELGASEVNPGQAILKERILPRAENVCVVADSSKLGRTSPFVFASLEQIDLLITDDGALPEVVRRVEIREVRVIAASADS